MDISSLLAITLDPCGFESSTRETLCLSVSRDYGLSDSVFKDRLQCSKHRSICLAEFTPLRFLLSQRMRFLLSSLPKSRTLFVLESSRAHPAARPSTCEPLLIAPRTEQSRALFLTSITSEPDAAQKETPRFHVWKRGERPGGVLLSHSLTRAVPSALEGLTSEFGMGSGVAPPTLPPEETEV